MPEQNAQNAQKRRIPFRNRITPDAAIAAIRAHAGQLSLAGEALGCSRGSLEQMVRRYPRVAKAARDAEARMTDIAVVQMHKLVLKGNYQACAFWLSSKMGRARGFAPPASDVVFGEQPQPRQIGLQIEILPPTGWRRDEATGRIIEHEPLQIEREPEGGTEDSSGQ